MSGKRYVAYYRVSTRAQGHSGLGLEGQQIAVRDFFACNPGDLLAEITEIESGRKSDRPKLNEALRLCRLLGAVLVIARLDRLSRSVALIARLIEAGVEFAVADLPEANRFTLHIFAAVAEYEAKLISERTKSACTAMKARGWNPAERLKGTRVARAEDLEPARAAKLRRQKRRALAMAPLLAELRDSGKSLYGVAAELNRLEIETPKGGRKWTRETARNLFIWSGEALPRLRRCGGMPSPRLGVRPLDANRVD
jgi:DNA invertase Pin-like site-specific DNA recombinase